MKFKIFKFKTVTSTNDVAIDLIKNEQIKNGYVYADIQTKGRGTHGKKWVSRKGNLFCSIFFQLKKNYPTFNEFSTINPIIVSSTIKYFCKNKNVNLKFPNDIFVNRKKVCGILQETLTFDGLNFLIIGIGINVDSNPNIDNVYKTTNIFLETKKKPKIREIIDLLIFYYEKFFIDIDSYNFVNFKKKAESMAINMQ